MPSWADIADEHMNAAKLLLDHGHYRGVANRSYYTAYASLTDLFVENKQAFRYGGNNPSHDQLLTLATHNLDPKRYGVTERRKIRQALTMLQRSRITADYVPGQTIDRKIALVLVREAAFILLVCGRGNS